MIFSQRKGPAKVSNVLNWLGLGLLVLGAIVELYISFGISGAAQMTLALLGSSTGHMIILFGLLLLVPGVLALWFKVLRQRIGNRLGLTTGLALSNLEKQPVRAALTASALTIVVAATIMMSGQTAALASSPKPMSRKALESD